MKIHFNKTNHSIEIKDGMKNRYWLYKFLIILNLLNAVLNLFNGIKNGFGIINLIWVVLGIVFTYFFYIYFYKKSVLDIIPVAQITGLKKKSLFGIKKYYFTLKNGKHRDLIDMKTETEFEEVKNMLFKIQIR